MVCGNKYQKKYRICQKYQIPVYWGRKININRNGVLWKNDISGENQF